MIFGHRPAATRINMTFFVQNRVANHTSMKFFTQEDVAKGVTMTISHERHEDSHVKRMNDCTYAGSFFFLYLNYTREQG
ncbi:hypothetical protein [Neobacillus sp. PS2-9]|uniref:hypothetical protein n=1 Tax=Neobacillus sp. PS2-9 TaxID=3070676 RepID=UPI0027DFC97E|nr:hypothetical protein [Neobacillus sp. PS2-9]WML58883.1 hypothetical protein RCG25_03525 [Neobacillus sp. PS2-9]